MYVKKPIELADDLESFLYVLLWMAMRFHPHMCSIVDAWDVELADLRARNATNRNLSRIVSDIFFEEHALDNGGVGGGMNKYSYIKTGQPPVILAPYDDAEEHSLSPLGILISQLYDLVRKHYATLDFSKLARFKVRLAGTWRQREETRPTQPVAFPSVLAALRGQRMPMSATEHTQPSASAADDTSDPLAGTRPLDTHREFLLIVSDFVGAAEWPVDALEKIADQFLGLGRMEVVRSKAESRSSIHGSKGGVSKPSGSKGGASKPPAVGARRSVRNKGG